MTSAGASWGAIGALGPRSLRDPLLQLHHAAQLVASAGQTFAAPEEDDSHRAMIWSGELEALVGSGFAGPYPFRVGLRPRDLTLLLLDRTGQALGTLPLQGRPRKEGYEWLSLAVATYLGGAPPVLERPTYELPAHPVADGEPFDVDADALRVVTHLYGGAAELLDAIGRSRPEASVVRCWPHHFDVATLLTVAAGGGTGGDQTGNETPGGGTGQRTIGVGLAPSGGGLDDWYWYVTPHPCPEALALPPLEGPGTWHTEGWTGAVLTGEAVTAADPHRRRSMVRAFVDEAVAASRLALADDDG